MDSQDGTKLSKQDLFTKYNFKQPKPPKLSKKLDLDAYATKYLDKNRIVLAPHENNIYLDHKDCERLEKFFHKCSRWLRGKKI